MRRRRDELHDHHPDASQLRQEAAEKIARAEQLEAQQVEAERQAAAARAESEAQGAYLIAVSKARENLAAAVTQWEAAGRELLGAQADRAEAQAVVDEAEGDRVAAWAELEDALKGTDLARIRRTDAARAAAERGPELVRPALERASAAVTRATESRDQCAAVVAEMWEAAARLGTEALEGIDRPEALPPPPPPVALWDRLVAELQRREEIHERAMRDPTIRARRAGEAAAAARTENAHREALAAGAAWISNVHRAAGR
jgi:hypothetical protein